LAPEFSPRLLLEEAAWQEIVNLGEMVI
jgi:hypothetical protein